MARVGIFWVYKGIILGKSSSLENGFENVPNIIDSPDSHIDIWENTPGFTHSFPELVGSEYQEIPRGRVLYSRQDNKSHIYMDKTLHIGKYKKLIIEYFELNIRNCRWMTDPHYTIDVTSLFDELDNDNY